jgi:enoyl-CoA hydratase/carnithine racemase
MAESVLVEIEDRVALITLNMAEKRNPISEHEMVESLTSALAMVNRSSNATVAILTGAGPAFSAGGDVFAMEAELETRRASPQRTADYYRNGIQRIPLAMNAMHIPMIAAVNGAAVGAGCDLACMCDIRIASERAKFAESFVRLGLIPGDGGAFYLQRVVGYAKAVELTLTGETIDAAEALKIGLVSRVVSGDELLNEARGLALRIAANPPGAIRAALKLVKLARSAPLAEVLELSAIDQALAHTTDEHRHALTVIVDELRRPRSAPSEA